MYKYLIAALVVIALMVGADQFGHSRGVNQQKVEDQAQFDKINADIAANKTKAANSLANENAKNAALAVAWDATKNELEKERESHRTVTADLNRKYSGLSLRFRAAQAAGSGGGGISPLPPGSDAASASGAPILQLPDQIAGDLRRLALDADNLNDDYRKCYGGNERLR